MAFGDFDKMLLGGSSLFEIFEHIRTFYPDQLVHADYFEKEYLKKRYGDFSKEMTKEEVK